ncbi:sensor histidine kinase [Luethyella okanaganae]|uniref:histidine kinase n=1 Tax=Luethyella okanaganae TaxID=69372 RepID=A0ABW1VCQ1_9MICO
MTPSGAGWSLRRRLVVALVVLLALVSALVGVVSVLALRASLTDRLDEQLATSISRSLVVVSGSLGPLPTPPQLIVPSAERVLEAPGQAEGTLAAVLVEGRVLSSGYLDTAGTVHALTAGQDAALAAVAADGAAHSLDLGGRMGDYRALVAFDTAPSTGDGLRIVIGLPLANVETTVGQVVLTVAIVAAFGIVLAAVLGARIVRGALRPLQRMAQTASRVAELPLDRGEVALAERIPAADADSRTEVGQVGAAFNNMLDHVAGALGAREASERKVRQFVADASHELRTPLSSIRGYSELTRRSGEQVPADIAHALSRIESESVRMTGLVEDLLLLARLDEGRELARDPVDLGRMIVDAVSDAHATAPTHEWRLESPPDPVMVSGDAPRLHQVVANLLANAAAHTPAGTVVVTNLAVVGGEAVLTVGDDGPGIDPSVRENLFERFARADSSRSRSTGSTGLGLAIVRAVVTAHGGSVSAESTSGETRFTVRIPSVD